MSEWDGSFVHISNGLGSLSGGPISVRGILRLGSDFLVRANAWAPQLR